mgnify:CR=1 FL=1|tara:strand:+ start:4835 stop:5224 length:390 start_codon:yes stop_codon:yes gene_type:complete
MTMNLLVVNAVAIAGAALIAIQPGEPSVSDVPALNTSSSACHIEMDETSDGLLVTAWGRGDAGTNYRMVVTQRMGGGGFDIVQEGDVPAGSGEAALLSDILLDTGAGFSARLSTWNAAGDQVCSWHEQA